MVHIARARARPITLVGIGAPDVADLESLHGLALAAHVRRAFARKLLAIAGKSGLAARTGRNGFVLMLPGVGEDEALEQVRRELGSAIQLLVHARSAGGDLVRFDARPVCMPREVESDERPLADWLEELQEDVALAVRWRGTRASVHVFGADEAGEPMLEAIPS